MKKKGQFKDFKKMTPEEELEFMREHALDFEPSRPLTKKIQKETLMKKKWNIIWRGCELREKGSTIDESYESWSECTQGIAEFDSLEEVDKFWERQAVSYGEEGGTFNVHGGWRGTFEDLKTGKERFHSKDRLNREIKELAGLGHWQGPPWG